MPNNKSREPLTIEHKGKKEKKKNFQGHFPQLARQYKHFFIFSMSNSTRYTTLLSKIHKNAIGFQLQNKSNNWSLMPRV